MTKKKSSKKIRKFKKIRNILKVVRQRDTLRRKNFPSIRENNNNSEEMLEEYKKDKFEEKKKFYEDDQNNDEDMPDTQGINRPNLQKDETPQENNIINFGDDERRTNSITNKDNISEFNNIISNSTLSKKDEETDETSEINFDAIATLSMVYHPISQPNYNNLPAPNQLQRRKNLNEKRDNVIEREAKKEKFG